MRYFFKSIFLSVLLSSITFAALDDLKMGLELYDKGEYDASYKMLYPLAKQGDALAQFKVGLLYDMTTIGLMDKNKAVYWYRKAANQGLSDAQYDMGVMYSKGEGTDKNFTKALGWYEKAAKQNHAYAIYNLGVIYDKGYGVKPDSKKSNQYYKTACDNNISKACYNLATKSASKEAEDYYLRAAKLGHAKSQFQIAQIYENSYKDSKKASKWLKEAAINKNTDAMLEYSKLLKKDGKIQDSQYWLQKAQKLMH